MQAFTKALRFAIIKFMVFRLAILVSYGQGVRPDNHDM
jgi:hypothetical protein